MDTACILWTKFRSREGYGHQYVDGKMQMAHRVAYQEAYGRIPDGMTVDHLCFQPSCVNPDHMRLLTLSENSRNQRSASKTHCINGHEFTPENTYLRPKSYRVGVRDCRQCIRDRQARASAKRRAS